MLQIPWIKIENQRLDCITDRHPQIAFSLESDRPGESMHKAVITVGDWQLETQDQINNHYEGNLEPFRRYDVHVAAWGSSGDRAEASSSFLTGRLDLPWQAKWITDKSLQVPDKISPVPLTFRRNFMLEKPLVRAWINASALGIYELTLNGTKVGKDYFAPGFTSYQHQIQYQTYDVTAQLQDSQTSRELQDSWELPTSRDQGRLCTLISVVGGGWAVGAFNYIRKNKISADRPAFLAELHLEYTDGTSDVIGTDEHWQVTQSGNYRMAEWYDGETYDATIELSQILWKKADLARPRGNPRLLADYGAPVRVQMVLQPVSWTRAGSGELIYDFGQNFAGVIHARLRAEQGQPVVFRHAEILQDGELFIRSLRTAKATATYICRSGMQTYSPRLTYMGFRYVGVSGIQPDDLDLTAIVLHSELEQTGFFSCSDDRLNRLNDNIVWSGRSNFVDIPTDCPQRDERQGWTGDIAVFARTACFHFDTSRFFDKWLLDVRSEQGRGGGIPMVVPRAGDSWPVMATSCWGDSCILVPWAEYLARGSKQLLRRQYPTIKRFLKAARWWSEFLSLTPHGRRIWRFPFHFGDWCAPDETARQWIKKGKWVGTAYFANSCAIAAQMADLLGENEDAIVYRRLRREIVQAYRQVFTDGKGNLHQPFQTAYVLPLYFDMTNETEAAVMVENLKQLVAQADNHLTTGFTGTPYILFALSDHGCEKAAFDLLLQDTCPSWLYEVKAGGTTIWERWDALRPDGKINIGDLTGKKPEQESGGGMVSFNHYANGAVGDWLYRRIAGIEPLAGGYQSFRVCPILGGGITFARAAIQTPYGMISSEWHITGDVFTIDLAVPVSANCLLRLPDGKQYELGSGRHAFSCQVTL